MKKYLILLFVLTCNKAFAGHAVIYSTGTAEALITGTTACVEFIGERALDSTKLAEYPKFILYSGVKILAHAERDSAIDSLALSTPTVYWQRSGNNTYTALSGANQAKIIDSMIAVSTTSITNQSVLSVDAFDSASLAQRGFALVTLDEINNIRQWIEAFKAQTALATNLTNFQSRVAGLPSLPDRTKGQILPAVKTKIQSGGAD